MKHRRGDGVCAHGEAADGEDVGDVGDEVDHDLSDERRHPMVETDLAEVDIVGRLLAAGESEVAVEHRFIGDEIDEALLRIRHPASLPTRLHRD